jgi:hypothetical protein
MKKSIFYLCCVLWLFSCYEKNNLKKQIEQFIANEIVVPQGIRQIIAGRDSVVINPASNIEARLIVWVDSIDCSSCRVSKLSEYAEVIDFIVEVERKFIPVFLFSPSRSNMKEVHRAINTMRFDNYPIFIDEDYMFSAMNPHVPADKRFHTFLIDKNGKVVLVGNPVNNPALWELYKTTITTLIENNGVMPEENKQ